MSHPTKGPSVTRTIKSKEKTVEIVDVEKPNLRTCRYCRHTENCSEFSSRIKEGKYDFMDSRVCDKYEPDPLLCYFNPSTEHTYTIQKPLRP